MVKKIITLLMVSCIIGIPMQGFAATKNYVPYITPTKEDEVIVGELIIDNTNGDLQVGDYFSLNLIGAEFDFRDNNTPKVYGENMAFERSSDTSVYVQVQGSRDKFTISFFSKVTDSQAKIVVDGEESGLSSGTYVFATISKSGEAYKGIVEHKEVALMNGSVVLDPITIKEPHSVAFRSLLKDQSGNDTLIRLELKNKDFELLEVGADKPITFVVDDGEDTIYYRLGRDQEVQFDYRTKTITFTKQNNDIFNVEGDNYSVQLINVKLNPTASKIDDQKIDIRINGLLVDDQTITIAKKVSEPLVLDASEEEIQPGKNHRIKFSVQEVIPGTLFSKGYVDLGVRGGAIIDEKDNFILKFTDGSKTYTQKDFTISQDSQGDQLRIKGFERVDSQTLLSIEGEFTVTAPERVTEQVYMFINEPNVSGVAKQTVLTASEDIIQPPAPAKPKVQFTVGQKTYKVDGEPHPIDASPYISTHQRIMVPIRYVAYALGIEEDNLTWDGASQTITIQGNKPMTINTQTGRLAVDGNTFLLSEIRLMGGRTFVPVGEIARAFGTEVEWDADTRTATFH